MTRSQWVVRDESGWVHTRHQCGCHPDWHIACDFENAIGAQDNELLGYTVKEVAAIARMHGWTVKKEVVR